MPAAGRHYADSRNADGGPEARGNVSLLSPYLRYRLLTEDEVIAAALAHHGPSAAGKFVQEVAWRTYWKGWLELRPAIWRRFLAERDAARGSDLVRAVVQAEAGATGIEGFDANGQPVLASYRCHRKAHLTVAASDGNRHRDLQLRGIQTNIHLAILSHGSSPMRGSTPANPAQPSLPHAAGRATIAVTNMRSDSC